MQESQVAPHDPPTTGPELYRQLLTAVVALTPLVAIAFAVDQLTDSPFPWLDHALALTFAVVIGHAVTIGFHRLFTHRSFEAARPLKITLAILGTMSFQGSLIGWVADHRRHHRYSERDGDPHSPWARGTEQVRGWRGLLHAHIGWTFTNTPTSREAFAPDLLADPDLVLIDRLFIPCCVATLALPFAIGYALSGTLAGALGALLWAGILRIGFTHNVTWSINSVCHRFGKRPYRSKDESRNVAALALVTMGESWHNTHHAFPRLARHGVDRGQLDTSAVLIRLFERVGWATNVQWPNPAMLAARRLPAA
jgi:stearoyl-CoA desaturase (delta-9 desaturase)